MQKSALVLSILMAGFSAFAQSYTLNPGDVNSTGSTLSCQVVDAVQPVPAPPPVLTPVLVGSFMVIPNDACINAITPADPRTIDNRLSGCGTITEGSTQCDSTSIDKQWMDPGCYSGLYAKETMPAAIHADQGENLKTACMHTRYNCYQNQ